MTKPVNKRWAYVLIAVGMLMVLTFAAGLNTLLKAEASMNAEADARPQVWSGR